MASASDHSSSEVVGSSATVVNVGAPPVSPVSSAQGSSVPDPTSHPAFEILRRLEGLVHRTTVVVSEGAGRYYDALPLVEAGLGAVRRVGGSSLARRCEQELGRVEGWMYNLKDLAHDDASDAPPPLSMRFMLEREERAKRIQAKEAKLKRLRKQHQAVLAGMDAYMDAAFFEDAGSLRGEARLRELERENMKICHVAGEVDRALQLLHQEEEDGEAALARLRQKQEEAAKAQRAADLSAVKAKIATFSLLKLL